MSTAVKIYEAHRDEPLYIVGRLVRMDYAPPQQAVDKPYHKLFVSDFHKDERTLEQMFAKFDTNVLSVNLCTFILSHLQNATLMPAQ